MSTSEVAIAAAVAQALVFLAYDLTAKRLGEDGVPPVALVFVQSRAWIPTLLLAVIVAMADPGGIHALLGSSAWILLAGFGAITTGFQFLYFRCQRMAHSLSVISIVRNAVGFPLLMLAGWVVNHDIPTALGITAIALLMTAAYLRPPSAKQRSVIGTQFLDPPLVTVALSAGFVLAVTVKDPLYRAYMLTLAAHPALAIAAYLAFVTTGFKIVLLFCHPDGGTASIGPFERGFAFALLALPILWILGTIPEALAFRGLPVYQLVAIGGVTWLITLATDLRLGRLAPSWRTAAFGCCVLASVALNIVDKLAS